MNSPFALRLTLLAMLLFTGSVQAQDTPAPPDNYTAIRLILLDSEGKVMVEKNEYGWMTPGVRYTERETIHETLNELARAFGLEISPPRLAGLFSYQYTFNDRMSTRQHYVAYTKTRELIVPEGKEDAKWLPKSEALAKMNQMVPSLAQMTNRILSYPEVLWGGAFELSRTDGELTSEIVEDFYPLGHMRTTPSGK